jgi:flagellin
MSNGITLQSNMRQGLSALQNTASLLASTQEKLSTGRKVNSALDNPLSFSTAQALSSRSSSLSGLMDGMSNSVQTVKAANTGAQNIGKTLDSIKGIIDQAKSAGVTTTQAKGTAGTLTAASAFAGASGDKLTIANTTNNSTTQIDISGATTVQGVIDAVNSGSGGNYSASLGENGSLQISAGGNNLGSSFSASVTNAGTLSAPKTTSLFNQGTAVASATTGGATQTQLASFAKQINDLMDSITTTGKDAGFNGTNLLQGGTSLRVAFNEDASSKLDIAGSDMSLSGLGLSKFGTPGTTSLANITGLENGIKTAKDSVSSFQGSMSNNLTIVQNRQDFTTSLTNILDTGAANLVNADMNEEAANLQALNTRQQIGQSALSLSNQANQGILQLLR